MIQKPATPATAVFYQNPAVSARLPVPQPLLLPILLAVPAFPAGQTAHAPCCMRQTRQAGTGYLPRRQPRFAVFPVIHSMSPKKTAPGSHHPDNCHNAQTAASKAPPKSPCNARGKTPGKSLLALAGETLKVIPQGYGKASCVSKSAPLARYSQHKGQACSPWLTVSPERKDGQVRVTKSGNPRTCFSQTLDYNRKVPFPDRQGTDLFTVRVTAHQSGRREAAGRVFKGPPLNRGSLRDGYKTKG